MKEQILDLHRTPEFKKLTQDYSILLERRKSLYEHVNNTYLHMISSMKDPDIQNIDFFAVILCELRAWLQRFSGFIDTKNVECEDFKEFICYLEGINSKIEEIQYKIDVFPMNGLSDLEIRQVDNFKKINSHLNEKYYLNFLFSLEQYKNILLDHNMGMDDMNELMYAL